VDVLGIQSPVRAERVRVDLGTRLDVLPNLHLQGAAARIRCSVGPSRSCCTMKPIRTMPASEREHGRENTGEGT
jgi:hypothetical protein